MDSGAERLAFYETLTVELKEAVSAKCKLDKRDESGDTARDYLFAEWQKTGIRPNGLIEPRIPEHARHVWAWFWRLNGRRSSSYMTINALTFRDIQAFSELYGLAMRPWEVSALCGMDDSYLSAVLSKPDAVTGDPNENARDLMDSMRALAKKPTPKPKARK